MTPTIQKGTKKLPPTIAMHAIETTPLKQFDAVMQTMPAVKFFPTQTNIIKNVEPALPLKPNCQVYLRENLGNIYVLVLQNNDLLSRSPSQLLAKRAKWKDVAYRHAYMEEAIEQGIAWQIKFNRERRGLTQTELGQIIGSHQSAISRIEDPSYGRHSLDTLVKIANAFDCALQVHFIPYSRLAQDSSDLSPASLYADPYTEEVTQ